MKILFIGMGLTQYDNQVLNRLNKEPGIEVFNLIKQGELAGTARSSKAVFQTKEGIEFTLVELKEIIRKKFSDSHYISYLGLSTWISTNKPDVIIFGSAFLNIFLYDTEVISAIKKIGIKLIRKDIPFRMHSYGETKRKIMSGEEYANYTPFFVPLFINLCNRLKIPQLPSFIGSTIQAIKIDAVYKRLIGRAVLLSRLEDTRQIMNLVDAHIDYIEEAFTLFESYGVPKEKIFIIGNSPDTDMLFEVRTKIESEPPILPYSPHRLIHIGRLVEWKRVDLLIESLADLKNEFPDAELLIIGYGPKEEEWKKLAETLNLGDSVKFIGGVYKPELLGKYLLASAVYVLAGMGGISINDAMAFGRPIICSVCDGTEKKLVRENFNGLYFKNGNTKDLTEKIRFIFENEESAKKMGENSTWIIKNEINIHTVIRGYKKAFDFIFGK